MGEKTKTSLLASLGVILPLLVAASFNSAGQKLFFGPKQPISGFPAEKKRQAEILAASQPAWPPSGEKNHPGIGDLPGLKNLADRRIPLSCSPLRLHLTTADLKNIRAKIKDAAQTRCRVLLFGKALDELEARITAELKLLAAISPEEAASGWDFDVAPPENFFVESMDLRLEVEKKDLSLKVYQVYETRKILLLKTGVALGGAGYDHALGYRRRFATPDGEFYLRRIVHNPIWYPPAWAGTSRPSGPGANSPYGLWMAELSRDQLPGNYGFAVSRDTGVRIHSTNRPGSIGSYSSHGCIRIHPKAAAELFPALLRYRPHLEGKKNHRGVIHPLKSPIKIIIGRS